MDIDSCENTVVEMKDPNKIIQMPIRIKDGIRDELKIVAIKKGLTLNELLLEYVMEGYKKDKKV